MYVELKYSFRKNIQRSYKIIILMVLYTSVIYYLYEYQGVDEIDIPMSISTVLGFAVSLLLGFRTNEAYDRWWEARKVWGAIVNDSRTLTRQLLGYLGKEDHEEKVRRLTYGMIAWNRALRDSLRDKFDMNEIADVLEPEVLHELQKHDNVPNGILLLMEEYLRTLKLEGHITNYEFVELDSTLKRLCDSMGMCERINNTVFPLHYRYFTYVGILIYVIMLPFGMLKSTGIFMIPICTVVFVFFATLERIAHVLQDPFCDRGSDTPMTALSITIERNLRQMLGEENYPEKLQKNDAGVLM